MKRGLLLVFMSALLCNCNKPSSPEQKNEIYKIIVETEGCFGKCPIQTFSMDSNLVLNYCGYMFTKDSGCFTGTIDTTTWNAINRKLVSINYREMNEAWAMNTDDAPGFDIHICYTGGVKDIHSMNYMEFPDSVQKVFDWIEDVAVTTKKNPADGVKFENPSGSVHVGADTTIQFTVPETH